eukprot:488872-Amorphochlora_amoeboformis.AAC.2
MKVNSHSRTSIHTILGVPPTTLGSICDTSRGLCASSCQQHSTWLHRRKRIPFARVFVMRPSGHAIPSPGRCAHADCPIRTAHTSDLGANRISILNPSGR